METKRVLQPRVLCYNIVDNQEYSQYTALLGHIILNLRQQSGGILNGQNKQAKYQRP